jgi:alkanesulfonate monooxygenase SsuD/methylene tetrahydromethanopterin reductase-like flavin-dependent oxidoreductase (luciferase family)
VVLPGGPARLQVDQAVLADEAGWDGVFVWEAAGGLDPWSLLAAMAVRTSRVRLGTMLTPLPWRRPWTVASQAAAVDQLSGGRAVLAVGLGAPDILPTGHDEPLERRARAALLDEGIDLVRALHAGRRHSGPRWPGFTLHPSTRAAARPVQQPGVPIWVVGAWPRERSMERVLRCDGVIPMCVGDSGMRGTTPDDVRAIRAWLRDRAGQAEHDIVIEGETPADDPDAADLATRPWAEAGCTWWMETRWQLDASVAPGEGELEERIAAGPPRS